MKQIQIKVKNVYGENKIYPHCNDAKAFACIAGTTTLTHRTLALVEQLGYQIAVINDMTNWKEI